MTFFKVKNKVSLMPMCNGPSNSLILLTGGGKIMSISKNGGPIEPIV